MDRQMAGGWCIYPCRRSWAVLPFGPTGRYVLCTLGLWSQPCGNAPCRAQGCKFRSTPAALAVGLNIPPPPGVGSPKSAPLRLQRRLNPAKGHSPSRRWG